MEVLIQKENIAVNVEAKDWQDAIRKAGQLLIDSDHIKEDYINQMIDGVKELGPYIVLTQGFALAHAAPNKDLVNQPSLSMVTLSDPVEFRSPHDPVKVVMCLACTDKVTHLDLMSRIAKKLMKENIIEELTKCGSSDELYHVIND